VPSRAPRTGNTVQATPRRRRRRSRSEDGPVEHLTPAPSQPGEIVGITRPFQAVATSQARHRHELGARLLGGRLTDRSAGRRSQQRQLDTLSETGAI